MTSNKNKKEQCHGAYGSTTMKYSYSDKEKWTFTDDLYKELKDSILKEV